MPGRRTAGGDAGSVTAELAVALIAVTVVTGGLTGLVRAGSTRLQLHDAAAAAARELARGAPEDVAREQAQRIGGAGPVAVRIDSTSDAVQVTVAREIVLPLPGRPDLTIRAQASSVREQP